MHVLRVDLDDEDVSLGAAIRACDPNLPHLDGVFARRAAVVPNQHKPSGLLS